MNLRSVILGSAVGVLGLLAFAAWHQNALVPVASASAVNVTFYDCGLPMPCEHIYNPTNSPITVRLANAYQDQTVTVAAHAAIDVALDKTDNQGAIPTP